MKKKIRINLLIVCLVIAITLIPMSVWGTESEQTPEQVTEQEIEQIDEQSSGQETEPESDDPTSYTYEGETFKFTQPIRTAEEFANIVSGCTSETGYYLANDIVVEEQLMIWNFGTKEIYGFKRKNPYV